MNTSYTGDIKQFGDTVKINSLNDTDDAAYSGSVTYSDLDDASRILQINQKRYVARKIDDVDNAQTNPKLMGQVSKLFSDGFLRTQEAYLAALYSEAGIVSGGTTNVTSVTSANAISTIGDIAVGMDEAEVPDDGRVAIVPPWLAQKIVLAGVVRDTDNSAILSAGYIGSFQGFQVYKSNRISHSSTTWYAPMFFRRNDTIALAEQLLTLEAQRLIDQFGDGMRALLVYGAKVVRPESLAIAYVAEGAESAI